MKYKELKKENMLLMNKLKVADITAAKQIEIFDKMCEYYEKQLKVQDKELARILTIIYYLENKVLNPTSTSTPPNNLE